MVQNIKKIKIYKEVKFKMRDLNKAMKKLQEAKRLESTKLAKLVKYFIRICEKSFE